ncbi:type VII secretion protein EccB [Nocardioides insulae]|uniref:type VII secretion protein EccB n=1 Tax=Nocardioides insulae TaxID=394734 RepID=UPI00041C4FD8|nr:type VII secretion protein EccB [Nocardioides insulae]
MATKKDLVEAHSFTRRRLVTAFLSGAPGGREVEPSRPGRTVVGGVALAVLLVAAAAIGSVLSPRTPADWKQPGLVISKDTGERYVILDEEDGGESELRPVINVTSAQLLLGVGVKPTIVQQDALDGESPGEDIGILGAPQQLPTSSDFINTGWTACTAAQSTAMRVHIGTDSGVTGAPDSATLVRSGGEVWMIAQAYRTADASEPEAFRYLVPNSAGRDGMLQDLGLPPASSARAVSQQWLGLFPQGGPLGPQTLSFPGAGEVVTAPGLQPGAKVGDLLEAEDGDLFVFATPDGEMVPLDTFERIVYTGTVDAKTWPGSTPQGRLGVSPADTAHWPDAPPSADPVRGETCAVLHAQEGEPPFVTLATDPTEDHSAAEVEPGDRRATIDPGHGALVNTGDWTSSTSTTTYVVDNNAKAYSLQGQQTLERLEYDEEATPLIPDAWIEVLNKGVPLSSQLALCPPVEPDTEPVTECP